MPDITLPDGVVARFPDDMPHDEIAALIEHKYPDAVQKFRAASGRGASAPAPAPAEVQPQQQAPASPSLLDSALATVNGLTGSVPFLQQTSDALVAGGQTAMDAVTGKPADFGAHYNDIQASRERVAAKAPIANAAGEVAGTFAAPAVAGATRAGAEAIGLTGSFLKQLINGSASTAAYEGVQGLSHGDTGGKLLADEGLGALGGAGGTVAGKVLEKTGQGIADALTSGAQRKLTDTAIKGAPSAEALRTEGHSLFDSSVDGAAPPAVSEAAYGRFMGDVQSALAKYRPNAENDPQAVGLLKHLTTLGDAAKTGSGAVVDLKDLHMARQLAQKVGQSPSGRDSAIGDIIASKITNFVEGLKPADILGGGDPKQATTDLMQGISTWSRATKVGLIEKAIDKADTYKSGIENGMKLSFEALRKSADIAKFSPTEQAAIREVAKGTTSENIAGLVGKLGISIGGHGAHNILSGGVGTTVLTGALTPVLGPAAFPAALTATSVAGAIGRRMAEGAVLRSSGRAAQVAATPNIPLARVRSNMLAPTRKPVDLLIRGGALTATNH